MFVSLFGSKKFKAGEIVSMRNIPAWRGTVVQGTCGEDRIQINWTEGTVGVGWAESSELVSITTLQERYHMLAWFWGVVGFSLLVISACAFFAVFVKTYSMDMMPWYGFITTPWIILQGSQAAGRLTDRYVDKRDRL